MGETGTRLAGDAGGVMRKALLPSDLRGALIDVQQLVEDAARERFREAAKPHDDIALAVRVVAVPRKQLLPPERRGAAVRLADLAVTTHLLPRTSPKPVVQFRIELTEHDREVLRWLSLGKRAPDIAEIMTTTVNAVHQSVHRIMNKLGASTHAGAVGTALRRGLIK